MRGTIPSVTIGSVAMGLASALGVALLTPFAVGMPGLDRVQPAQLEVGPSSPVQKPMAPVARAPWANELQQVIYDEMARYPDGDIGVFIKDLEQGQGLGYHDDAPMYLASGIKLLFLVELYRQREAGTLAFDETLRYRFSDVRDGAPAMNRMRRNQDYPIWELVTYMLRDSDNTAADLLLSRIGAGNVRRGLARDGLSSVGPVVPMMDARRSVYRILDPRADRLAAWQVRDVRWRNGFHPRLDILKKHIGPPYGDYDHGDLHEAYEAYYALGRNHVAMRTIGAVLERMWQGELVSEDASRRMLARLENVWSSGHRIRGAIPKDRRVFHKTGTQHRRICDLAIVELSDGRGLVVAIAVEGIPRLKAERVMATVAKRAFELAEGAPPPRSSHPGVAFTSRAHRGSG